MLVCSAATASSDRYSFTNPSPTLSATIAVMIAASVGSPVRPDTAAADTSRIRSGFFTCRISTPNAVTLCVRSTFGPYVRSRSSAPDVPSPDVVTARRVNTSSTGRLAAPTRSSGSVAALFGATSTTRFEAGCHVGISGLGAQHVRCGSGQRFLPDCPAGVHVCPQMTMMLAFPGVQDGEVSCKGARNSPLVGHPERGTAPFDVDLVTGIRNAVSGNPVPHQVDRWAVVPDRAGVRRHWSSLSWRDARGDRGRDADNQAGDETIHELPPRACSCVL